MKEKTMDVKAEITEQVASIVGKLNAFDSKQERADTVEIVLNSILAGVELSKLEKAGIMSYLMDKRIKG